MPYFVLQNKLGVQRKIVIGSSEQALPDERIVNVISNERIGLGDLIAKSTSVVGIKSCNGCTQRQQRLNKWWFDLTEKLSNVMK